MTSWGESFGDGNRERLRGRIRKTRTGEEMERRRAGWRTARFRQRKIKKQFFCTSGVVQILINFQNSHSFQSLSEYLRNSGSCLSKSMKIAIQSIKQLGSFIVLAGIRVTRFFPSSSADSSDFHSRAKYSRGCALLPPAQRQPLAATAAPRGHGFFLHRSVHENKL